MSNHWNAMYAFVERSFYLIKRYFAWEVVFLFYNIVNTITIGLIGLTMDHNKENMVLYLVIGALLWGFMSVLFEEVANSISWERWEGTIEYTFMAPVKRVVHLAGTCLFAVLYGLFRTIIVLIAVAFFFDINLQHANLLSALISMIVATPAFMGLGLIAAVLPLLSPEKGTQATHIIQGLILLISGIYYPVSYLPHWLQPLAYISPGTYALESTRSALLNGATLQQLWPNFGILLIMGAVLVPLGLWVFSVAENYAMRVGKLKRSG